MLLVRLDNYRTKFFERYEIHRDFACVGSSIRSSVSIEQSCYRWSVVGCLRVVLDLGYDGATKRSESTLRGIGETATVSIVSVNNDESICTSISDHSRVCQPLSRVVRNGSEEVIVSNC